MPVKLYYAKIVQGTYGTSTTGYIAVKNLSYQKDVSIHYLSSNTSTWQQVSASYLRTNTDGYEVWSFNIPETVGQVYTQNIFYIQYNVNGQTYYDNNGGNNYIATNSQYGIQPSFGKSGLFLDYASLTSFRGSDYFDGAVRFKSLSSNGNVKVRYTTNNWQTYSDVNAYSIANNGDSSIAYFSINLTGQNLSALHYAVCYTANGVEYWDNNFGINY